MAACKDFAQAGMGRLGTCRTHDWRPEPSLSPSVMGSGSVPRRALRRDDGVSVHMAGTGLGLRGLPHTDAGSVMAAGGSVGKPQRHPPSFFIPARKHFLSLQYRHWFLLSLSTTHCLLNLGRKRGVRSSKTEPEGRTRQCARLQATLRAGSQRLSLKKEPQPVPFPRLL